MKSLAERLKAKEAREAKERLKRSSLVKTFSVRIPYIGCPSLITDGDTIYINKRAREVMKTIRAHASWQFYQALKEAIAEIDKKQKDEEGSRNSFYRSVSVAADRIASVTPVDPAVPTSPAQPAPVVSNEPPVPTPTTGVVLRLESPGVLVRDDDTITLPAAQLPVPPAEESNLEEVIEEIDRELASTEQAVSQ